MLMLRKLEPPYVPQLADADDRGDSGTLDVIHFDKKYTLEPPIMSPPPRRRCRASMEAQFEALELEYMSPETRNSVRDSMRSTGALDRPLVGPLLRALDVGNAVGRRRVGPPLRRKAAEEVERWRGYTAGAICPRTFR